MQKKKKLSQKSAVVLQKAGIFNVFFFCVFNKNFEQWHF